MLENSCGNMNDVPCQDGYFEVLWAAVEIIGAKIFDLRKSTQKSVQNFCGSCRVTHTFLLIVWQFSYNVRKQL